MQLSTFPPPLEAGIATINTRELLKTRVSTKLYQTGPAKPATAREISYTTLPNRALVKICSESCQHPAWHEFHRRFDGYIRMYIKKSWKRSTLNGDMDSSCAAEVLRDMCQDVYLKLLENDRHALKNFNGEGENSFLAYLSRIAVNVVAEYFRKQLADKRKGQMLSMDVLLDESASDQSGSRALAYQYLSCSPERELIARVTMREITEILKQILDGPNMTRDMLIFKLHAMEGYTTEQVAGLGELGLKASSVESILRRTRNKLRNALHAQANWPRRAEV